MLDLEVVYVLDDVAQSVGQAVTLVEQLLGENLDEQPGLAPKLKRDLALLREIEHELENNCAQIAAKV